jgi:hypothetical protein
MRIYAALPLFLLVQLLPAQPCHSAYSTVPDRTYQLLRETEDWSFLRNPALRTDFWDPIKYVPLRNNLYNWYLSFGGEVRLVWEHVGNDNWGQQPYWNSFFLQRYMGHVDARLGKHFRAFVQLKSGIETFRQGGPRPIDEKRLDFEAGFIDICSGEGPTWIAFRAGRQELNYGSGRLVSVREGPNVRQSFDGFKIMSKIQKWHIDGWAVRPDVDNFGYFDNNPNSQVNFWGIYSTRTLPRDFALDLYYLGLARKEATYNRGTANELRHSFGARLSRDIAPTEHRWDFDYEGVWQAGTFGSAGIRAWTFASESGYTAPTLPLKPRFSLRADISSGDNPNSPNLGTFYPFFPIGNYFGVLADTGPGPLNFFDVHPRVITNWPHNVNVMTDILFYWRQSLQDGVYSVPGFLIRPAGDSRARFVGYRPGTEIRWQINRHAYLQLDYGVFFAGPFLRQTMPGSNLNYLALWAGYKF